MKTLLTSMIVTLSCAGAFAEGPGGSEAPYNGADYSASYRTACTDGQRTTVLETFNNSGDVITAPVTYVCRGGKFVSSSAPVISVCKNGSKTIVLEVGNDSGEVTTHPVQYTCVNGKWVR